ncbi:oligosaccharide flippase family protein [Haladaptatus sp. DYF46]|uniref:oligosaccharide flippase family protein n=1 Tax=Haladaptatus sp. DYF46 TaxID=2886041 RepID=UPI001E543ED5|nr:oligosaccharide flippase family protein [Haladaptatus sp. DYF46]
MSELNTSLQRLFKGGSVVFVGLVLNYGLSFIGKVAISRYLGKFDYGALALGIVLITTIERFALLGVDKGVARYLPRFETDERQRGVILSGLTVALSMSILFSGVAFLTSPFLAENVFHDSGVELVLKIFSLAAPFAVLSRFSIGVIRGMSQTTPRVIIKDISQPIVRVGFITLSVLLGYGIIAGAIAYAVPYIVATILGGLYLWKRTPLCRKVRPTFMYRELLQFSSPLAITGMMWFIFSDIDTFLLGASPHVTTGDIGVYQVVYPLVTLLTTIYTAFGFITMPVLSGYHSNNELLEMRELYRAVSKWIFVGSLPLFLIFFSLSENIIYISFGEEYMGGTTVLSILSLGFATHVAAGPNSPALTTIGKSRLVMYDSAIAAILNIILNLVLIPQYGLVGAAIATTVSYACLNILLNSHLYLKINIHPISRAFLTTGIAVISLFYALKIAFEEFTPIQGVIPLITFLLLFATGYSIIVVLFAIEDYELLLLRDIEDKYDISLYIVRSIAQRGI